MKYICATFIFQSQLNLATEDRNCENTKHGQRELPQYSLRGVSNEKE